MGASLGRLWDDDSTSGGRGACGGRGARGPLAWIPTPHLIFFIPPEIQLRLGGGQLRPTWRNGVSGSVATTSPVRVESGGDTRGGNVSRIL